MFHFLLHGHLPKHAVIGYDEQYFDIVDKKSCEICDD